jgi:hypothetical protein
MKLFFEIALAFNILLGLAALIGVCNPKTRQITLEIIKTITSCGER